MIITLIPFGRGSISGLEASMPFLLASFFLFFVTKKSNDKKKALVLLLFFLWAFWIIIGIFYSYITYPRLADHEASTLRFFRLIEMYLPSLFVFFLVGDFSDKQRVRIYKFYIILFFMVTIEAVIGWVLQINLLVATQRYSYPGMGYIFRAGGVANDSSAYGSLILILGIAAIIGLRHTTKSRILHFAIIICFLINIYISLTRTLIFALLVYFICEVIRNRRISLLKISMFIIIGVTIIIYGVGSDYMLALMDRVSGAGQTDISSGRLATWASMPDILADSPLLGVGYRLATDKYGIIPDNVFLSSLLETGLIGFSIYMGLLISICYCVYKNNTENLPLLIAYIASGLFVDISTFWVSIPALIFFMSICKESDRHGERMGIGAS